MFGIYVLLPAFVVSCLFILVVSLVSKQPSAELQRDFEEAKAQQGK